MEVKKLDMSIAYQHHEKELMLNQEFEQRLNRRKGKRSLVVGFMKLFK